ncbi:Queuine tRNA-ribosyltransferase subunit qtrtd1 [Mortierella polycephala]|uniref:Queuine tRNA-ribosyltransferase accessory subunit 2 n=1 Tax=Mortierella polycephala TaxID=41804 RepID=A0A9P6TXN6_9FUNG|nr:Queuine tRNA-ribosyltransferase subunit qtrtd1 [Mortierella polycephala]
MSPLTFNIIRQSTQLSAARRGTVAMAHSPDTNATSGKKQIETSLTSSTKRVMETPGCFMYSVKGSVPHLTPDTLRLQGFGGVNVSIEHILQDHQPAGFDKWPFSLSKFLNLQDLILLCDIRDSSRYTKVPFNSDRHISMKTRRGVRQLTFEEYLKVVRAYEPDIIAAYADSISDLDQSEHGNRQLIGPGAGFKRVCKSVDRSLKWLDQILQERQGIDTLAAQDEAAAEIKKKKKGKKDNNQENGVDQLVQETKKVHLDPVTTDKEPQAATKKPWAGVSVFAHVLGAQIEQERIRSAEETAKREGVDGFIVDTNTLPGSRDEIFKLMKTSLDHLPTDKPRLIYGMQTPEDVLRSIALGADLFDTSYPFHLTEDGKASVYSFGSNNTTSPITNGHDNSVKTHRWINLWDDEHADKFVPILKGCGCYACYGGRHTRAYINHLLKSHEMLATVLLMGHNMHQYSEFFSNVRQSIQDGTFEQHSALFVERFGTEPERTGEIHAAQIVLEAALARRNRLDGDESEEEIAAAALAAEEKKKEKERLRKERRENNKTKGLRNMMNKKEERLAKERKQEQPLHEQHQQHAGDESSRQG